MDTLTHRERISLALDGKDTDHIPIGFVCSGFATTVAKQFNELLMQQRNTNLGAFLNQHLDIKHIIPPYIGPPLPKGVDYWGVKRKRMYYSEGNDTDYYAELDGPVLEHATMDEILAHPWPSADWFDYSVVPDLIKQAQVDGPYSLIAYNGNIFESSWFLRSFEQIFLDMALQPEVAHAIFSHVTDFFIDHFTRLLAAADGEIDLVFTADDVAGQEGLLMSPEMWEQQLKPFHTKLNRAIHNFGAKVIYHSCGSVMRLVPGFIDMGVDILNPLQFTAVNMDPGTMKKLHGDRVAFQGGVSVQKTLLGSKEGVREEVEELVNVLGQGGGYILGPSHIIQLGTPAENILTMFDTALNMP